jgi:DnaK suppressor protein
MPVSRQRGKVGMETLQEGLRSAGSRSAHPGAGFLSRQRYRLEKARDVLLRELGDALEDDEAREERTDRSSCTHVREAMVWLEMRLGRRLGAVERALEKIEEGTYGTCDVTGEAITLQRLEAMPKAFCTPSAPRRPGGGP